METQSSWRRSWLAALGLAVAYFATTRLVLALAIPSLSSGAYGSLMLLDVFAALVALTAAALVLRERRHAGATVRASEAKFRQLAEAVPHLVWTCRPEGPCDYLSPQWVAYTGIPEAEQLGSGWLNQIHPEDREPAFAAWTTAVARDGPFDVEYRLRRADGAYRWFKTRAAPLKDAAGRTVKWYGTNTDIDDLRRARAELQLIFDTVPALIFYKDRNHRLVRVNEEMVRLMGLPREAIEGHTDSELGSPHEADYRRTEEEIMTSGRAVRGIVEPVFTLAGPRWVQTSKLPYRDPSGRITGIVGFSVDITERKLAEDEVHRLNAELERRVAERTAAAEARAAEREQVVAELWDQKQLLQTILDSLGEAVLVADKEGQLLLQNKAFQRLHPGSYSFPDMPRAYGLYLPDGVTLCPADRLPIARAIRGEPCDNVELIVVEAAHPEGVPVSVTGRPILGPNGVEGGVVAIRDVTAARAAEAALRESEQRYALAVRGSQDGIWDWDMRTGVVYYSPRWKEMLGFAEHEVANRVDEWERLLHPDDRPRAKAALGAYLDGTADSFGLEVRMLHKDDGYRWIYTRGVVQRGPDGSPWRMGGSHTDVTARRATEESLREGEARFRSAFDHAATGMALVSPEGRWLKVNESVCRMLGYTEGELLATDFQTITHPEDLSADLALVGQVLRGERTTYQMEKRYFHKAGHVIHVLLAVSLVRDARGEPLYFVSQIKDITERKRAEQAMRASEEQYRETVEAAPDAIVTTDARGTIVGWNRGAERVFGHTAGEVVGRDMELIVPPQYRGACAAALAAFDPTRPHLRGRILEVTARHKGGNEIPVEIALAYWGAGTERRFTAIIRDATERKRAEDALRASEAQYRTVVQAMAEGVVVQDRNGVIVTCNDRAPEILGLTRDQIAGRTSQDPRWRAVREDGSPFPGDEHPAMVALRTGEPLFNTVMGVHTPDGELRWVTINAVPLPNPNPDATGVVVSFHDVTAIRTANERLLASVHEKEVMLKEIHHRVKNNLQIISTLLDLQSDGISDPPALAAFRESRGRVRSMALIHERLYRSENLASVEFGAYLRGLAEDLFGAYRVDADAIRLAVSVSVPPVPLDVAIPCGLLVNELISNCLKYAFVGREGGIIGVSLEHAGAGFFVLTVADDGVGVPSGFDFRRTSSFGLQLVNTLVDQLGGTITLESTGGMRFAVRFPSRG